MKILSRESVCTLSSFRIGTITYLTADLVVGLLRLAYTLLVYVFQTRPLVLARCSKWYSSLVIAYNPPPPAPWRCDHRSWGDHTLPYLCTKQWSPHFPPLCYWLNSDYVVVLQRRQRRATHCGLQRRDIRAPYHRVTLTSSMAKFPPSVSARYMDVHMSFTWSSVFHSDGIFLSTGKLKCVRYMVQMYGKCSALCTIKSCKLWL